MCTVCRLHDELAASLIGGAGACVRSVVQPTVKRGLPPNLASVPFLAPPALRGHFHTWLPRETQLLLTADQPAPGTDLQPVSWQQQQLHASVLLDC